MINIDENDKVNMNYNLGPHQKIRWEVLDLLGGKCNYPGCDVTDKRMLHLDHINGDGYLERNNNYLRGLSSSSMKKMIRDGSLKDKLQNLCANHHSLKSFENGEQQRQSPFKEKNRHVKVPRLHASATTMIGTSYDCIL